MPMTPAPASAGDAERQLLEALAQRYAVAEFTARTAAADIPGEFWLAAGVARPDPAAVGRWLRVRKGAVAGYVLASRPNRDGVALWKLRGVPPSIPRDPAPAEASPAMPTRQGLVATQQPVPAMQAPQAPQQPPQRPWWHMPIPEVDAGLPEARWACGAWWAPDAGSAP